MKKPQIKYTDYTQHIGNGWILEKKLLMHGTIAWTIYRYDFIIGSDSGTNIDSEPHPGYTERYTKFWSSCSDAEEQARAIAQQLLE